MTSWQKLLRPTPVWLAFSLCHPRAGRRDAAARVMPADEWARRMERMRAHLLRHNVYRGGGQVLSELLKFDFPEDV